MNFNDLSKQELLDILEQDGLKFCKDEKESFLTFKGSSYDYFKNHSRGEMMLRYFARSKWFIENVTKEILSLVTYLNLGFNNLTNFQIQICECVNLVELNLVVNKLTSLPTQISKLQKLELLHLKGNNFSEQEKTKIKALLPNCEIRF